MASSKERLRWDQMFSAQTKRMERQREALTRAMLLLTEANAALFEIATGDDLEPDQNNETVQYLRERAQTAIERMTAMSVSVEEETRESDQQFTDDMKEATDG